ncbi:MAG: Ig-like domain-containing protein, partial [Bifidobacteriaceae bacterium]|nr:Ig-like domain-containing protein [Bifidobacteriaceae bacterium]
QANVLPDNARSKTIKFSSANSDIVSVDSSTGLLQANPSLTENSALFITAAALNGVKAQIEVQVKILPTDMTVTPSSAIIGIDGTFSIQVSAIPSAAGTQLYSYDSSNPLIATVKNNYGVGRVTGVNQGEAIITVYMVNTSISKTLSVSVRRAVTGVSLTPETNIVSIGQKLQLTHSVIPQNAYNTNVTYTSQSPDIAVVNLTGEVVGVSPGNTTITVSTNDGNFQAFSDVLVTKPVTGVVISPKSIILDKCIKELVDGEMIYIQCPHSQVSSLVSPIDATNLAVNYSSSDENIATVTKAGVIEGQNVGQANIVATTFDGSFTDVCQVTIKQTNVFVQGLAFSPQEVTVNKNEEVQLNPVFSPWQASDKSLTYTSANSSVATVSQTGLVKGVSQGITTITAKSNKTLDSSEVSAVAEISVEENFVAVTKITLSPKTHTLEPGETVQLVNVVEPANASDDTVSFASSNSAIASVSPTGLVTAQALGSATITVTTQDRGLTDTSIITVQPPYVAVTGFSLQPESQTLNIGEDQYLQSVILPDNASNIQVNFSSSNPDVATVTQTGLVVAVSSGSAVITGITADGNFQDTCLITVLVPLINVETVSLDKTSLTINIGETEKLIPAISPANATDKSVSWQSSNPSVATVDNQGLVSAVSYGKARIDAVTVDGGKIASCQVSVNVPEISVITVVLSPDSAIINIGQNLPLNTQVLPANASDKTVSYRSSNDQVVSVSQTGIVTGLSVGTATITVRTNDGNFEDTSQITVVQPFIPVESVTLTPSQISLNIGQTAQLSAVVLPDNATNKVVEYYSSDSAVATVSQTGLVTAISTGAAVITVETESGDYMDTAVVSVNQVFTPIIGVGIYPNKLTLNIGESQTVTASIVPNNATIKTVVWSSLDPIIASVDQAGEIFARSPGMVKIRAASIDGSDVFGEATVNVIEPTPIYMITDVSPTDQAWPSIEQMYIKKYTNGCSSQTVGNTVITKYCPSDSVKREQMAAFLYYLKGYPDYTPPAVSPFSDLKSDNQFYKQIMWGVANGVWSGYEDKTFKGSKAITRGQFVSVLWRFYGNPEPVLPPISPFSDIKSTDAIYKAIIWAKNNSITTGYEDGTFKPNKTCSRAQMAMFIIRSDKNARTYFE